jgi:hypothetical protein
MDSKARQDSLAQSPRRGEVAGRKPPVPQSLQRALKDALETDQQYFEQHPSCSQYTRGYIPHEFYPYCFPPDEMVTVSAVSVDIRIRQVQSLWVVDCVTPEAVRMAPYFFPATGLVASGADGTHTHYWYFVDSAETEP